MSLSGKINDVLHTPESDAANRGEVDQRTPGAFPTDDMAPSDSQHIADAHSHDRNRLHKANDPRGQNYSGTSSGLTGSNQPAATNEPVEQAYAPAEGYENREEHARRHEAAGFGSEQPGKQDTTQYPEGREELGATAGTSTAPQIGTDSSEHNTVRSDTTKSNSGGQDPYWGKLPAGQGVYNTVAGHGSNEDSTQRSSGQGGVYNTIAGHGSSSDEARRQQGGSGLDSEQRSFPLVTDRTREQGYDNTSTTHTSDLSGQQKDSNWKEGAVGAGATGAAGAAAYKATHEDDQKHSHGHHDKTSTEKDEEKKKSGGFLGLFGHKDKDNKEKDHKHEESHHHSKEQKSVPLAAAAGAHHREDERRHDDQHVGDSSRSGRTNPALAAASTAFAKHDDNTRTGTQGDYNTLASGTPSGVRTGDNTATARDTTGSSALDERKEANRHAGVYGAGAGVAGLGAAGLGAHEYRKDHDNQQDTVAQSTRTEDPSRTTGSSGWFAGATGTGVGTQDRTQPGAYTSDSTRQTDPPFATQAGKDLVEGRKPTGETYPSGTSQSSTAAAVAGLGGAGAGAAAYSATHGQSNTSGIHGTTSSLPRESQTANQGQYNTLSDGTPSGINTGGASNLQSGSTMAGSRDPARDNYPTGTSSSQHGNTAAAAGLGAGAAGLGAAAYSGSHHDNSGTRDASSGLPRDTQVANQGQYNTLSDGTPSGLRQQSNTSGYSNTLAGGNTSSDYSGTGSHTGNLGASAGDYANTNTGYASTGAAGNHNTPELPHITETANKHQYNVLSSGTPSGVALDDSQTTTTSSPSSKLPTATDEKSHHGAATTAGLAAAGAGATGAGAAAYGSRDKDTDSSHVESTQHGAKHHHQHSKPAFIPGKPGPERHVIHTCTNCGDDQDISKYFDEHKTVY